MEKPTENIDWQALASDEEVKDKLKDLVFELHLSSIEFRSQPKGAVEQAIKDHIASRGFPTEVAVFVSEPNEAGQRMVMGMAHSPLTPDTISF
ncbi:MAG: hypothetical protein UX89_C0011G0024 [Parcubacteria group bacterium GW2011_GWA2_47_16]|nr:MAG: hypothetical protein UX89_C0011G0024 [Parcubacteria group bacterium GW2011_GWA2_47_16]